MKRFTKFVVESIEEADLDEAVEVRHDRYLRSHGKKARDTFGGGGTWAFTHKDRGDVDYNNDKEIYKHSGKFADAKKAAQQWGKKHGHREVYVMESVELDEAKIHASWKTHFDNSDHIVGAPRNAAAALHKKLNGAAATKKDVNDLWKSSKIKMSDRLLFKPNHDSILHHYDRLRKGETADYSKNESVELDEQTMSFKDAENLKGKHLVAMDHHKKSGNSKGYVAHSMVVRKFEDAYDRHGTSVIPSGRIVAASQKAFKDYPHSSMKEEVELDEARSWLDPSDHEQFKNMTPEQKKARHDSLMKLATTHKNYDIRSFAKSAANELKSKYMKEEAELDEVSDKMLDRYRQKAFADQPSGDDGSDKYRKRKFGRDLAFSKQTGRAKVLATKEEVEQIDEISKKTLVNYMDKSKKQAADIQKKFKKGTETKDDEKTFDRRVSGQIKALDKFHGRAKVPASGTDKAYDYAQKALRKEEVELDEASTKIEIPKSRYLTIAKEHNATGPTHGKVTRSPKGTMQYKGARHLDHDKKTDTHIEQTYSHRDHGLATIEKHTHNPSGKVKYYIHRKSTNEAVELDEVSKKETDKFHRDLDKLVHKTFGHSSDEKKEKMKEAVNESVNDMVRIGQKMLELAPKEKNDMISNAYSRLGDALTRYGTPFGPKNVVDLEKKTGMNQRIIMSLIKKVQQ
jgi:hypothetical protein